MQIIYNDIIIVKKAMCILKTKQVSSLHDKIIMIDNKRYCFIWEAPELTTIEM